MPEPSKESKSTPKDSRLDAFMREAMAVLSAEKVLNAEAQVKLKAIASRLNLPHQLYEKGLKLLANPSADLPQNRWEKAFVQYLDRQFSQLPGQILTGPQELRASQYGVKKFQLTDEQCEHWIRKIAEKKGIACISQSEALEFAELEAKRLVDKKTNLDFEDVQRVFNATRRLGISELQCEQVVRSLVELNRSEIRQNKRLKRIKIGGTVAGVVVLTLAVYGYLFYSGGSWRGDSPEVIGGPNPDHVQKKAKDDGLNGTSTGQMDWVPDGLETRVKKLNDRHPELYDLSAYFHSDPLVRKQVVRLFFQKIRKVADSQLRSPCLDWQDGAIDWRSVIADLYRVDPDENVQREILDQLSVKIDREFQYPFQQAVYELMAESVLHQCLLDGLDRKTSWVEGWIEANRVSLDYSDRQALIGSLKDHREAFCIGSVDRLKDRLSRLKNRDSNSWNRLPVIERFEVLEEAARKFLLKQEVARFFDSLLIWCCRNVEGGYFQRELLSRLDEAPASVLPKVLDLLIQGKLDQQGAAFEKWFFQKFPNQVVEQKKDRFTSYLWFLKSTKQFPDSLPNENTRHARQIRLAFLDRTFRKILKEEKHRSFDDLQYLSSLIQLNNLLLCLDAVKADCEEFDNLYLRSLRATNVPATVGQDLKIDQDNWRKLWESLRTKVDWQVELLEDHEPKIAKVVRAVQNPDQFGPLDAAMFVKSAAMATEEASLVLYQNVLSRSISNPWVQLKIADFLQKEPEASGQFVASYFGRLRLKKSEIQAFSSRMKEQAYRQIKRLRLKNSSVGVLGRYLVGPTKTRLRLLKKGRNTEDVSEWEDFVELFDSTSGSEDDSVLSETERMVILYQRWWVERLKQWGDRSLVEPEIPFLESGNQQAVKFLIRREEQLMELGRRRMAELKAKGEGNDQ